jgi:hypothetical protein
LTDDLRWLRDLRGSNDPVASTDPEFREEPKESKKEFVNGTRPNACFSGLQRPSARSALPLDLRMDLRMSASSFGTAANPHLPADAGTRGPAGLRSE